MREEDAGELDVVVLVDAPEEVRVARPVRYRGLSEGEAAEMVGAQMHSAASWAESDYVIENTGFLPELTGRIKDVWAALG